MPFSGPSSYLSTIDEFIGHWTDVDAELTGSGGDPLVLGGPYGLADLQADRTALAGEITALEGATNVLEGHRTDRNNDRPLIKERIRQLGALVRGVLASSQYVGQIPPLIQEDDNSGKWIIAMDDASHMWTTINASPPAGFTPPLVLTGGYTVAMFNTDIAALKTTLTAITTSEQDTDRERDERDALYRAIRAQLVLYRQAVAGMFPEDHPHVTSLPRLDPLPGHTPDAVVLSGAWNVGTAMADLSWTASTDPDLEGYSVRRSGATPYDTTTEQVVDTLPPGTLALSTNEGLGSPGSSMGFKVYVELTTGNEKGSNTVTINRP